MTHSKRYHKKPPKARQRRLQRARKWLQREQAQAARVLRVLEQAVQELGVPETVAAEVSWHLHAHQKLVGKIFGMMFPPVFGCRSYHEFCRVRGWDKHVPSRLLRAVPKRKWIKRLQRLGQEVLVWLWRQVEHKSPATRSRWLWTWVSDDSLFKK